MIILQPKIKNILLQKTGASSLHLQLVEGGCINQSYKLLTDKGDFFCKINSASKFPDLFAKEAAGLSLIAQQNSIKVPKVIECFKIEDLQFLILEWINTGEQTQTFWEKFGSGLAALHSISNTYFGLHEENYMGSVVQSNQPTEDWITFFREQRLEPLVTQCTSQQLLTTQHRQLFEKLYLRLPPLFETVPPALLHGDLWSGNFMCNERSEPVLIDPAVYFGHRSMDLGMTTLFGGFQNSFYTAYQYHFPLTENSRDQQQLCNLYPLLIHLLLFGKSYLPQIEHILQRFQ